jgi:UDP-2,3-diacylglucosamine pyrophosphatase LpxH
MITPIYDTIIISDTHLGSSVSLAKELLHFLKSVKFKRLILLGDIFADLNFSRLNKEHWNVLSYLRELSNPKHKLEIVWVYGNHDADVYLLFSHLLGIEVSDRYEWMANDKKCIALHGHQFDPAIKGFPNSAAMISWWFLQLQKIPGLKIRFARWIDHITSHFQNLSKNVEDGAYKYAKLRGFDVICCGHTHKVVSSMRENIEYYNSGCWVKTVGTYITFLGNKIQVQEIDNGNKS